MMKRSLFTLCASMLALAMHADPIGRQEASMIASQYVKDGNAPKLVRTMRRSNAKADNAPLYIFSRGAGQGFVIVAGDNCVTPVIGYTESGDYDTNNMPPALLDMLEGWTELIENAQAQGAKPRQAPRQAAGTRDIGPLIKTHWSQGSPYNDRCPMMKDRNERALSGCVATAASQVAYYWHKDSNKEVQYNTPTYDYGGAPVTEEYKIVKGTPYNWELMLENYGGNAAQRNAVATLMAVMGMSTYLTYGDGGGTATSGQISNLVGAFSGQFALTSECQYKGGYSASAWESKVIEELEQYQPIVYSGVHPTNGGHAIVLDGYRIKDNLFHFNFGWGGQGDGYYTLDDNSGVNGFSESQGMTFKIKPKKFNLSATIKSNGFIQKADNKFSVVVENNSSIPYKGLYVFISTSSPATSDLSKATKKELETEIPIGESREIEFSYKPSLLKPYIVVVCDKNGRTLVRETIDVTAATPDLRLNWLQAMDVASTQDENITVDCMEQTISVGTIYNTNVSIKTDITNSEKGTYVQPSLKVELFSYNEGTCAWDATTTKTVSTTVFDSNDTQQTVFPFTKLKENVLYKARLDNRILTNTYYYIDVTTPDSVAYFRVQGGTLAIESNEGGTATLTGMWNVPTFNALATDGQINVYDLTAVENFGGDCSGIVTANPNAMIYAAADATGNNIIVDGKCRQLNLKPGHAFTPKASFTAENAKFEASGQTGIWTTVYLPFDVDKQHMPTDAMARNILSIQSGMIYTCDSVCREIKSCTPYLVIPGRETLTICAANVEVSTDKPNVFCTDFAGTFVPKPAVKGETWLLDKGTTQYFDNPTVAEIAPMSGYITNSTKKVRANSYPYLAKDQNSVKLAKNAIEAQRQLNDTECSEYSAWLLQTAIDNAITALAEQGEKYTIDDANKALAAALKAFNANPNEDGEITPPDAIDAIHAVNMDKQTIYDLGGRAVKTPNKKGIYIINGKKIIK